jgi:hypothetical protein
MTTRTEYSKLGAMHGQIAVLLAKSGTLVRPSCLSLAFRLLLFALVGCASSRSPAGEKTDEDASSRAGSSELDCPLSAADANFGTNDSEFGAAYGQAKAACDRAFRWQCGEMMVTLDAAGCVVAFGKLPATGGDLATGYADCMLEELAGSCSRCEHEKTRRFYESCTIL